MRNFKHLPLSGAIMAIVATQAAAEEKGAEHTFKLDQVTVAATLTEEEIGNVSKTVSVLNEESISTNQSTDIRNMIRYEPGVEVGTTKRFGNDGFNIRGMDQNRVKVVVDGVDQASDFKQGGNDFQQVGRNAYDPESMKQVEIIKGPGSSLYGSNAIGGVVSFATKDPSDFLNEEGDDIGGYVKTQYTSADSGKHITGAVAGRSGVVEGLLLGTARRFDEVENMGNIGGIGDTRTENDPQDNDQENILGKLQFHLENHTLGFTYENFNLETETDALSSVRDLDFSYLAFFPPFPPPPYHFNYLSVTAEDKITRERFGFEHEWHSNNPVFDTLSWSIDTQETKNEHGTTDIIDVSAAAGGALDIPPGDGIKRVRDYSYEEDSLQLNAVFNKEVGIHNITYGLNYEDLTFENENSLSYPEESFPSEDKTLVPEVDGQTYGIFIQDQISLMEGKLLVTPGLRWDDFEADPSSESGFAGHNSDNLSARLGAVYKLPQNWSIFGQYAEGFKTPDLLDMYFLRDTGFYLNLPNPGLDPEKSDSYEVGVRKDSAFGNMELVGFYNKYDDFIDTVTLSTAPPYISGITQSQNIDEAYIKGLEFRGALWLDEAINAPVGMSLQGSIAYAKGREDVDGGSDVPLDSVAPLTAVLGLAYNSPDDVWGSTLNLTMVDRKDENDVSEDTLATTHGYGVVDLIAYYNISGFQISGGLFNAFDKEYTVWEDIRGQSASATYLDRYTQPGRNFSVSLSYDF